MNNSLMAGLERNYKRTGANQGARRVRVEQVTVDTPVVTPAEPEASQDTRVAQLKAVVARFQS